MAEKQEDTNRLRYQRMLGQLDLERSQIWADWRELNDFILPTRGRFFVGAADRNKARSRRSKQIIDCTASFSARTLSSGMMSGVTSPARPWFRLTTPDPGLAEFASVKDWLHQVTERMLTVFIKSNLYNKLPIVYSDLGVFGTAAMFAEENESQTVRFYDFPIGSYYLANDDEQRVRVFARPFEMTVRQLVLRFGVVKGTRDIDWSRLSPQVKNAWDLSQYETYIEVVHVIEPNQDFNPEKLESKYKRFRACYYEKGYTQGDNFLEEKGFDEFPLMAPRWEVTGEDTYGTNCPGMLVLGDIKQLQLGEKRGLIAIEKMVTPPMIAGSSMRNSKLSLLPGDVSDVDETVAQTFRPAHKVEFRLSELEGKQNGCRNRIQSAFFADLFLMMSNYDAQKGDQPPTAREIDERHEEKLLALGPVLEQLNQDLLDPVIERSFNIMLRRGLIPPAPKELEGMELKVDYTSIMAAAQKAIGRSGLQEFTGYVTSLVEADPSPGGAALWDKVDRDEAIAEFAEMAGVAPHVVVPEDKVNAIRQARAQAQQKQEQAALIAQHAKSAKDLSQADTTGKNALTDVLGNLGGPTNQQDVTGQAA